jgi:hypothetical protein
VVVVVVAVIAEALVVGTIAAVAVDVLVVAVAVETSVAIARVLTTIVLSIPNVSRLLAVRKTDNRQARKAKRVSASVVGVGVGVAEIRWGCRRMGNRSTEHRPRVAVAPSPTTSRSASSSLLLAAADS